MPGGAAIAGGTDHVTFVDDAHNATNAAGTDSRELTESNVGTNDQNPSVQPDTGATDSRPADEVQNGAQGEEDPEKRNQGQPSDQSLNVDFSVSASAQPLWILRNLHTKLWSECSYAELLGSWTQHLEYNDPQKLSTLLTAWKETSELVKNSPVIPSDKITRLNYIINERLERSVTRSLQLYQAVRLRKLLLDPESIIDIESSNPDVSMLEDNEREFAKAWRDFVRQRELPIAFGTTPECCAHISADIEVSAETFAARVCTHGDGPIPSAPSGLPVAQWNRLMAHDHPTAAEGDLIESISKMYPDGQVPAHFAIAAPSELFRLGIYKQKMRAQL